MHHYELNRGQWSIDLYTNSIKCWELVPPIFIFKDNKLKKILLLAAETYLVPFETTCLMSCLCIYKPIIFMVGSNNINRSIFYQIYLLPRLNIPSFSPPPFFILSVLWNISDVVVGLWITSTSLSGYEKLCCDWINEALLE